MLCFRRRQSFHCRRFEWIKLISIETEKEWLLTLLLMLWLLLMQLLRWWWITTNGLWVRHRDQTTLMHHHDKNKSVASLSHIASAVANLAQPYQTYSKEILEQLKNQEYLFPFQRSRILDTAKPKCIYRNRCNQSQIVRRTLDKRDLNPQPDNFSIGKRLLCKCSGIKFFKWFPAAGSSENDQSVRLSPFTS